MKGLEELRVLIVALVFSSVFAISVVGLEAQASSVPSPESEYELDRSKSIIWQSAVGEGFLPTVQTFGLEAGLAPGIAALGSVQPHDLALLSLPYGHTLGHVLGEGHWYRGNFEAQVELLGGGQYSPSGEWLIGLTPHLRYDFATGTRWIPFLEGGAGVTATGIGPPDLSGTFEFNLQATIGVYWFVGHKLALTGMSDSCTSPAPEFISQISVPTTLLSCSA